MNKLLFRRLAMIDEKLSVLLRKLELLQLERRLDGIIEEEEFPHKTFKEQF